MSTSYRLNLGLKAGKVRVPVLRHYVSVSLLWLFLCEGIAFLLAYVLSASFQHQGHAAMILATPEPFLFSLAMLVGLSTQGLFRAHYRYSFGGTLARIVLGFAVGLVLVLVAAISLRLSGISLDTETIFLSSLISCAPIFALHALYFQLVDESEGKSGILVLGAGPAANSLSRLRRRSDLRTAKVHGFVKFGDGDACVSPARLVDITPEELSSYAAANGITEILVAVDDRRGGLPIRQLLDCKMRGIHVVDLSSFFERETGKIKLDLLRPSWLIFSDGFDQNAHRLGVRRMLDVFLSAALLSVLFPLMLATAAAIVLDGGRGAGVFYRQKRTGLNGKTFEILKFRSMVPDAEAGGRAQWAEKGDKRITSVGSFLRKFRIDELPQLINVLMGDMSLVGPRPERPEFVEQLRERIPYYDERHRVKPGITGWAQLNYPYGSSENDAREKLEYDLYYVKNNSLLLDIAILLQTAEVIFFQKGSR